eukprot:TRINITY_DN36428_c0_g3_i1.p1 TRINITY_DN36428_c0_g3~~TRINITY_DN36428_c0_g3_i1.p1  ORF type:complete len:410 (-),score=84.79 TRINITY_DN36428_c0_g3_i1:422-1651(-)
MVGVLHRCATYFVGTGLFGMWQDSGDEGFIRVGSDVVPMQSSCREDNGPSQPLQRLLRTETAAAKAMQQVHGMWELERRKVPFIGPFEAPSSALDGDRQMKWCKLVGEEEYVKHPFLAASLSYAKAAASEVPPVERVELLGQLRRCSWAVMPEEGETDELGWQYASGFSYNWGWTPEQTSLSQVRRRFWIPSFYQDAEDAELVTTPTLLQSQSTQPRLEKLASTLLVQKGLDAPGSNVIFDEDICEMSLDLLREQVEAADWAEEDSLMAVYFRKLGAKDLEISAWGTAHSTVKGKLRSVEYRMPLPPQPMCPSESRMQGTYHVASSDAKVVLESATMALDVPIGSTFNVISCDSFTVRNGKLRMTRSCAVEWLASCWVKGMVEKQTVAQGAEKARLVAGAIREWAVRAA